MHSLDWGGGMSINLHTYVNLGPVHMTYLLVSLLMEYNYFCMTSRGGGIILLLSPVYSRCINT